MSRPRVLLLSGYFDWFSGYQETVLAKWLGRYASTEVVAGDRVSPLFSDEHLSRLEVPRRYAARRSVQNGVAVTRFATSEVRSMVWSAKARKYINSREYDLIVQAMPGQILPLAATLTRNRSVRIALYGDNSAMWSHLSRPERLLKGVAFSFSKGIVYALVNCRAQRVYGFTPNTVSRLRAFRAGKQMPLLPLAFDPEEFYFDEGIRDARRLALGYDEADTVIVAAGKFQQKKRLDLLATAFKNLAPAHPGLRLLLTGTDESAESRELVERISEDSILRDRVAVLGFVGAIELNALFNAADIGVWPRMPAITIQQAMGTGLKVVLPENAWVGHLIRVGSGAYFNEAHDNDSVAMERAIASQLIGGSTTVDRRERARTNSWLGADQVARSLLDAAGLGSPPS